MGLATLCAALAGDLRGTFSGDLHLPGDPGYDEARRVKNGMIDRRRALIGRPTDEAAVSALVNLARERVDPVSRTWTRTKPRRLDADGTVAAVK
jgi:hypothetical protein